MRELTFKGFLSRYLRSLSDCDTNDIKRLAAEVPANYRIIEPLVLYAAATKKLGYLEKVANDSYLLKAVQEIPKDLGWDRILQALEIEEENVLRSEYLKCYKSYVSVRDRYKTTNRSKNLLLMRTRELQQQKSITAYRLYTDLGLNHGNVNSYLKNGEVSKVSLEVAEKLLAYLENS